MADLLNVDWAIEQILKNITPLPAETVTLPAALGRILAENVVSPLDLPPFPNSSLDGYAVRAEDTANAPVQLPVVMDIPAGIFPDQALQAGTAARIMTGAPIPEGANAIVAVEDTDTTFSPGHNTLPEKVTVYKSVAAGSGIRHKGENVHTGQTILEAGTLIRPQDIGMLASIGISQVRVTRPPRVAILSTGDELLEIDKPLSPGKIYDSNSYMLEALVASYGGIALRLPTAPDTLEEVRGLFRHALEQKPDMIISSAGVSVGEADYVRVVLEELGKIDFWRINLRPGKPLAYGQIQGIPFFGLPGNPVSAIVTFEVIVRPALLKMLGRLDEPAAIMATLAENTTSDGRRSYHRVKLYRENGQLFATSTGTQSSGALMSMVVADGLMVIPEDVKLVKAGTPVTVRLLRYMK